MKAKSKNYFTKQTEEAIVAYNNTQDKQHRNHIYNTQIKYAFFKLTENIIHTYKFYHTECDSVEDLQHEVTSFLISKLHLFNPEKGAKAYSYFGTVAKRYLIASNNRTYKRKVDKVGVSEVEDSLGHSYSMNQQVEEEGDLSKFIDAFAEWATTNLFEMFPKQEDAKIADAVLELFRKRKSLDVLNKKALYIYIREQINVKTPKITRVSNYLYEYFKQSYLKYLDEGYISFGEVIPLGIYQ